mgnify:CR=1 FL=1
MKRLLIVLFGVLAFGTGSAQADWIRDKAINWSGWTYTSERGKTFALYENSTVRNWKALSRTYARKKYRSGPISKFIKSCLEACGANEWPGRRANDDACSGGVALIYRDKNRTMPTMCLFASRESEVMPVGGSSRQTYDFYQQLCYPGGPYTEQCQKNNVQACWSGLDVGEDNKRTWFKVVDKDMPGMYFKKYGGKRNTRTITMN